MRTSTWLMTGVFRRLLQAGLQDLVDAEATAVIERMLALSCPGQDALRAAERDGFKNLGDHVFCEKHDRL